MEIFVLTLAVFIISVCIYKINIKYELTRNALLTSALYAAAGILCSVILSEIMDIKPVFVFVFIAVGSVMFLLSLWDLKEKTVPSLLIYILMMICMFSMFINPYSSVINCIITGIVLTIAMFFIYKISKNKIGGGDVKVISALGFAMGYPQTFNILFSAMTMAIIWGLGLVILKKADLKTEFAFLPFLTIGFILNIINL